MKIMYFDIINSTQDYAMNLIKNNNIQEDTLIVASIQTDGKGRLKQRKWISDYGNFHGSFIINIERIGISINNVSHLNTLVMHSIFKFLVSIVGIKKIQLKLPNDIYYNNKKLAGVLIEVLYPLAIVGIGINVYSAPLDTATSLYNIMDLPAINTNNIFDQHYGLSKEYCDKLYKMLIDIIYYIRV